VDQAELIDFVRLRGLGVVASRGPTGSPQAALVGIAATDQGELVFDCSRNSRKYTNIERDPDVAVVVGWDEEVTVQIEGLADVLKGEDLERCKAAYFEQYPDGRHRAELPEIAHIRVTPRWLRYSDYRPETFSSKETVFYPTPGHPGPVA
jgi:general stress protein 26